MILEIAHPNEAVEGRWTFVEEFEGRLVDHIASPAFDVYRGLCVRVREHETLEEIYVGIFNDRECVDVGFHSDVMREQDFDSDGTAREFSLGKSWIECWATIPYPDALIHSIVDVIDRRKIVAAMAVCVEEALRANDVMSRGKILLAAIHSWVNETPNETMIGELVVELSESLDVDMSAELAYAQRSALFAVVYLGNFILNHPHFASNMFVSCIWAWIPEGDYKLSDYNNRRRKIADDIRRLIPFHEIAEELVRP